MGAANAGILRNNAVLAKPVLQILYIAQFCWMVLSDYIYLISDGTHGICYSTKAANCTSLSTGNRDFAHLDQRKCIVLFLKGLPVLLIARDLRALKVPNCPDQSHLRLLARHLLPIVGGDSGAPFKPRSRPPAFACAVSWVILFWFLPPWMNLRHTL